MSGIRTCNVKIKSLLSTKKITKTMKMVSASKLYKAHEAQKKAQVYAKALTGLTSRIAISAHRKIHPLMAPHNTVKKVLIVVMTSNKGLCGAFNHNTNRGVVAWIKEHREHHEQVDLSFCGKRGHIFFSRKENIKKHYKGVTENPKFDDAEQIGRDIVQAYLKKEYDEIYLAYSQFFSPLSQKAVFERILPIDPHGLLDETAVQPTAYVYEPAVDDLLEFLVPHYLYFKIYFALLENAAGEHGSRMTSMDSATKNATELIDKYTLLRNRARQAEITRELIEIVSGAEALK